jgi:VanZ family protein
MNLDWLDRLVDNVRRHKGKIILANAAALLAASWLPASLMVRTQALPGYAEHALAYFVTGICLTLLLQGQRFPPLIAACISAYAAVLEFGQIFVPGRHAALTDFIASSVGGLVGVATCAILGVAYWRMIRAAGLRQPSER